MKDSISNLGLKDYFNNISWIFVFTIIMTIIFSCIVIFIIKKKGKLLGLISSILLGIFGFGIIFTILGSININPQGIDNTLVILNVFGKIFISFMSIIIPFYIFVVITSFVMGDGSNKIKKLTNITSFASLIMMSFYGLIVALLILPLINFIPSQLFENINHTENAQNEKNIISFFTNWKTILLAIILAITFSISIRIIYKKNKATIFIINSKIKYIMNLIMGYIKILVTLIPFVIMTKIMSLGLLDPGHSASTFKLMGIYFSLFWLGSIFIFVTLFLANIFISNKDISIRKKAKILLLQVETIFANQSIQSSLSFTQSTTRELGVSKEISELTPTQGTIMGMVMCNGFTPMLVIGLSLAADQQDMFTFVNVFLAASLILLLSISTSGSGSADYTIILTILSILGISSVLYLNVIIPVQEVNETTIVKPNNSLGHIFSTQLTERIYKKEK